MKFFLTWLIPLSVDNVHFALDNFINVSGWIKKQSLTFQRIFCHSYNRMSDFLIILTRFLLFFTRLFQQTYDLCDHSNVSKLTLLVRNFFHDVRLSVDFVFRFTSNCIFWLIPVWIWLLSQFKKIKLFAFVQYIFLTIQCTVVYFKICIILAQPPTLE